MATGAPAVIMDKRSRYQWKKVLKYVFIAVSIVLLLYLVRSLGTSGGPTIVHPMVQSQQTHAQYKMEETKEIIDNAQVNELIPVMSADKTPDSELDPTRTVVEMVARGDDVNVVDDDDDDIDDDVWDEFDETLDTSNPTNIEKSVVRLLQDPEDVHLYDTLHVVIETRDVNNKPRTHGSDFWYAIMYNELQKTRIAGRVLDHHNGTYSVYFYATWTGYAFIDITLVHIGKATQWLREVYWPKENKIFWTGHFREEERMEQTHCVQSEDSTTSDGMCYYGNPSALGSTSFVCRQPPTLPCHALYSTDVNFTSMVESAKDLVKGKEDWFSSSSVMVESRDVVIVKVKDIKRTDHGLERPKCNEVAPQSGRQFPGYWMDSQWTSLLCDVQSWQKTPLNTIRGCLQNKQIYLLGDSMKQFYEALLELAGLLNSRSHRPTHHDNVLTDKTNFTLFSPPWPTESLPVKVSDTKYETGVIDELDDVACNYVIIISSYTYFLQWPLKNYEARMKLIKEALLRLRGRCPNTAIVIKGTKPNEHFEPLSHVFKSDYILFEMNNLLKKMFQDSGFYFLDVWDMNLSYPAPHRAAMPVPLIRQEVAIFLSYMCPVTLS
ncbi:NXPE family member 3-like [Glandiceps talaboti]